MLPYGWRLRRLFYWAMSLNGFLVTSHQSPVTTLRSAMKNYVRLSVFHLSSRPKRRDLCCLRYDVVCAREGKREACIPTHRENGVSCKRYSAVGEDSGDNKDLSATLEMTIREGG